MSKNRYRCKRQKEWWGKRPLAHHPISNNSGVNKFFKRLLHKKERLINKNIIKEFTENDNIIQK